MKLQALLAAPALFSLLAIAALPAPQRQDPSAPPIWDLNVEKRNQELYTAIQGGWSLTKFERPGMKRDEVLTVGFLLIGNGFLSLELHGAVRIGVGADVIFQTGMHSFDFNELGQLELKGMIGTYNMGADLPLAFERPGVERKYRVVYGGETLELTRLSDSSKLSFRRLKLKKSSGRDIYGREVGGAEEETE